MFRLDLVYVQLAYFCEPASKLHSQNTSNACPCVHTCTAHTHTILKLINNTAKSIRKKSILN